MPIKALMHRWVQSAATAATTLVCLALPPLSAMSGDRDRGPGQPPPHRIVPLQVPVGGQAGFARLDASITGIQFTNPISIDRQITNQIYLNGSGVAAADVDQDGLCDVLFAGLSGRTRLFRNLGGWKFADTTREAGLLDLASVDATGVCFADIDGDRDPDLLVNTVGAGTWVLVNDGKARFSRGPVLNPGRCGASLALADADGDGDLDLYVVNYRITTVRDDPGAKYRVTQEGDRQVILEYNGRSTRSPELAGRFSINAKGRVQENGEPDAYYLNNGRGGFEPVSFTQGAFLTEQGVPLGEPPHDWGLSVLFRDFTGDGSPDLYVCNDFESPDRIWLNRGDGTFRAASRDAFRHTSMFSMGVDAADVNRDGRDDLFVVDMLGRSHRNRHVQIGGVPPYDVPPGGGEERVQYANNTLFLSRGDGTFAEVAWASGVEASEWSWSPVFLDVDLDGYEDLLVTNGHERDAMNADVMEQADVIIGEKKKSKLELLRLNSMFTRLNSPNVSFRNRRDGTFDDMGDRWGFASPEVSHGMCLADLDGDGDLDALVNNLNGPAGVYRNETPASRVAVRLRGGGGNTSGAGARISFRDGSLPVQSQEVMVGGRYLSADEGRRVFACASTLTSGTLEVRWRSGRITRISDIRANSLCEISEKDLIDPPAPPATWDPLFEDVSPALGHRHHDDPYNDLQRQPLLPWHLSRPGPGVCWTDLDSDGWMDLAVGGGRGGILAVYRNLGKGGFQLLTNASLARRLGRDTTGLVATGGMLMAGSANYEDGSTNGGSIRIYDVNRGVAGESLLGPQASTGPLALGDLDGDGDLDLFVGSRAIAGQYPAFPVSRWYRNEGGRFHAAQTFPQLGLVSGVVLTDLDGDGDLDAVVACDWGPIRMLKNDRGELTAWAWTVKRRGREPGSVGLESLTGWWRGVATGDLDGDGRPDIVASNQGINTRHQASEEQPWLIYSGDITGAGGMDLVEARRVGGRELPQRSWRMIRSSMPFLAERVAGYEAYSQASVQEIYGERLAAARRSEVTTVETVVLVNRGDHFELRPLPREAQLAPASGVCIADFDGDGSEDVFLAQNFHPMNPEYPRGDAGRGLVLTNDGSGWLTPVAGDRSGVKLGGDQRGCAVADFDGDGRIDLVVGQNNGPTGLFRNRTAAPGLSVRFNMGGLNPEGVGAALRLVHGDRRGPLREIQSGSGYGSQNSPVVVMGRQGEVSALWVRWPGGKESTLPVPKGAVRVEIQPDATLRKIPDTP